MKFVTGFNACFSRVAPFLLLIVGVAVFYLANFAHNDKVLEGMVGSGGAIIGGALMLFRDHGNEAAGSDDKTDAAVPPVDVK